MAAAATALWLGHEVARPAPALAAAPATGAVDSDGDMLVDALEWVLLSDPLRADSDGDGTSDFIAAVEHGELKPVDHDMRVSVHAVDGDLYVDLMVRWIPGEQAGDVNLYLQTRGQRISINHLFVSQLTQIEMRQDPVHGTLLMASARICEKDLVKGLLPATVGVRGTIGTRSMASGILLDVIDNTIVGVVPLPTGPHSFALHAIDRLDVSEEGSEGNLDGEGEGRTSSNGGRGRFWQGSKTCELLLVPIGSGGGSTVTEVGDAACTGAPTMACAPSCADWSGKIYVVEDLLPYLIEK